MAHQLKHFFQYQEEKQQRSDGWTADAKKPPGSPPHDGMDAAELSYYEHKFKLKKTQVTHRAADEAWEGEEPKAGPKYSRAPRERQGEPRAGGL